MAGDLAFDMHIVELILALKPLRILVLCRRRYLGIAWCQEHCLMPEHLSLAVRRVPRRPRMFAQDDLLILLGALHDELRNVTARFSLKAERTEKTAFHAMLHRNQGLVSCPGESRLVGREKVEVREESKHSLFSITEHTSMASAYKTATRTVDDTDSELDVDMPTLDSDETVEADTSASDTSDHEAPQANANSKLSELPVELRNRILMLTSRGVSHR